MNRRTIALFFLMALAALPAAAYTHYDNDCYGRWIRWQIPDFGFAVSPYLSTPEWRESINAARTGWNNYAPGTNVRIGAHYDLGEYYGISTGNGTNELGVNAPGHDWPWGNDLPAITIHQRSNTICNPFPMHFTEVDILLRSPSHLVTWDKSTNPTPSNGIKNSTLIMQHEFGHALGIGDEGDTLARMNGGWPGLMGGPLGSNNQVTPLPDDVRGMRAAYGTASQQREVAGSAVRQTGWGTSEVIPSPGWTFRNAPLSFAFTVHNIGTSDENIPVNFYLSPTRTVNPNTSFYLGSTTVSLQAGRTVTGTATVHIPSNAPSGTYYYLGWFVDPANAITPENNESNNGTSLVGATYISDARRPNACFTVTPQSGNAPLYATFNASCSTDADGDALTYTWDFGDGTTGSGKIVTHDYFGAGQYVATLTVTDPYGATHWTGEIITVTCNDPWLCPEDPD